MFMRDAMEVEGDNHRLVLRQGIVEARIWKRPDLDLAQGAENARRIEATLLEWLKQRPRGLWLDVSAAPEVAGPKTEETIGAWFRAYAAANVRVAVQVGASAVQRMQYQRLLQENAGARGRLCGAAEEARAFLSAAG